MHAELGMRDGDLFLIHPVADEHPGDFLMTVVRDGVHAFLHGLIVAMSIGRYDNVVIDQVPGQIRQLRPDPVADQFRHLAGTAWDQMGVVVLAGGNHKISFGGFVAQRLDPIQRGRGHIQADHAFFGRYRLHGGGIVRVAVPVQLPALEPATGDGREQHRNAAFFPHPVHKTTQIILIGAPGSRIAGRIVLLGIVVAKLDEHIIAGLDRSIYLVPEPQVDETLGAAAILGVIDHRYLRRVQEILQHHTPAAFLPGLGQIFFGHSAVPHQMDSSKGTGYQPNDRKEKDAFHQRALPFTITFSKVIGWALCTSTPFFAVKRQSRKETPASGSSGRPFT